jgi:class 3 adenylate cyclase
MALRGNPRKLLTRRLRLQTESAAESQPAPAGGHGGSFRLDCNAGAFDADDVHLLGPGVLFAFVAGRYYHPRREERILLFIDMRASTAIAERLGEERFLDFLNRFITDLSLAIAEAGGEIHKYVGDEIIATWTLDRVETAIGGGTLRKRPAAPKSRAKRVCPRSGRPPGRRAAPC